MTKRELVEALLLGYKEEEEIFLRAACGGDVFWLRIVALKIGSAGLFLNTEEASLCEKKERKC